MCVHVHNLRTRTNESRRQIRARSFLAGAPRRFRIELGRNKFCLCNEEKAAALVVRSPARSPSATSFRSGQSLFQIKCVRAQFCVEWTRPFHRNEGREIRDWLISRCVSCADLTNQPLNPIIHLRSRIWQSYNWLTETADKYYYARAGEAAVYVKLIVTKRQNMLPSIIQRFVCLNYPYLNVAGSKTSVINSRKYTSHCLARFVWARRTSVYIPIFTVTF